MKLSFSNTTEGYEVLLNDKPLLTKWKKPFVVQKITMVLMEYIWSGQPIIIMSDSAPRYEHLPSGAELTEDGVMSFLYGNQKAMNVRLFGDNAAQCGYYGTRGNSMLMVQQKDEGPPFLCKNASAPQPAKKKKWSLTGWVRSWFG